MPAPRAAIQISNARAEASRRNGARSRGPQTPEGKARSAQNALKHGLRAEKHVVLPHEDAAEFAELEAAMVAELAPVGALQTVLARRVAVAAWRLARADRLEVELFAERSYDAAGPALALIRDGNGTRTPRKTWRMRGICNSLRCVVQRRGDDGGTAGVVRSGSALCRLVGGGRPARAAGAGDRL
jgi:hypothetical protein